MLRAVYPLRAPRVLTRWFEFLLEYKTPQQIYYETYLKTFLEVIR